MIAIQSESGDLVWLDAVLSYRRQYSSSISSHPIEDGSNVTDHVTQENPRFSISGIITNADFNTTRPVIDSTSASQRGLSTKGVVNSSNAVINSSGPIIGGGQSLFEKYLPSTITQFIEGEEPSVEVPDNSRRDWVQEVETYLIAIERGHELVTILEFDGNVVKNSMPDCYINSVIFSENAETGAAIEVDMELERVKFVTLREETVSKDVVKEVKEKTEEKKNKGSVAPVGSGKSEDGEVDDLTKKDGPSDPSNLKKLFGMT